MSASARVDQGLDRPGDVVATWATSDPKCGSVSANAANRSSPRARPPTQRSFCTGVPISLTTFCPIEPPFVR